MGRRLGAEAHCGLTFPWILNLDPVSQNHLATTEHEALGQAWFQTFKLLATSSLRCRNALPSSKESN